MKRDIYKIDPSLEPLTSKGIIHVMVYNIIHVMKGDDLQSTLERHRDAFRDGLGKLQGYQAKIIIEPEVMPKFYKARTVPYSMNVKIEEEIDRLVSLILQPEQFLDWATPIVPVLKSDKSVKICSDFKVTVNPVSRLDRYSIPRIKDLFATLSGGTTFTKLDMSLAYQQIELEDSSKQYPVINGLFQYSRLPFGISSAPEGIRPIAEKVDAIKEAPSTRNLTKLKSSLGLLTYHNCFSPNLSTVLFPLTRSLQVTTKEIPVDVVNQRRSSIQRIKRIINLFKSTSPL